MSALTYLDHAATTPLRPEVAAAMAEVHEGGAGVLGNPTGSHPAAQRARRLLEEARDEVAAFLGRGPGDVVFTSGGTESANLAVLGTAEAARRDRGEAVLLYSAVEHPAVRESARAAAKAGLDTRELPVDHLGIVDPDALARMLSSRVTGVAVMTANNETGVLQPLPDLIAVVRRRAPNACVFTDAVQAAPFIDLAEATAGADLVSLSAHKVGGPVGVGALAVAGRVALEPRQYGGGQERERRSGTQDVAGAVGLATALRLVAAERATAGPRVAAQRDRLRDGLLHTVEGAYPTVSAAAAAAAGVGVLPGHVHLCVPGVEREELLVALGEDGVCVSGGSSCASGALQPSHVLAAMGVAPGLAEGPSASRWGMARRMTTSTAPSPSFPPWSPHCVRGAESRWHTGPMRVLVAMSGGVDSSVAAALLVEQGHEVVGATLKLWGGPSDSGCCSVADVEDARRVAQQLGITHHVFNLTEEFDRLVVSPYVGEHAGGGRPTRALSATAPSSSTACSSAPTGWASTAWPRAITPASRRRRRRRRRRLLRGSSAAAPTRPRTSPTCCRCSGRTRWPAWCSPWAT